MFIRQSNTKRFVPSATVLALGLVASLAAGLWSAQVSAGNAAPSAAEAAHHQYQTVHKTVTVNGLEIFYREAGPAGAPTIVLLHGFPTSSHMFRNLIPALADGFHLVAPDYPGFGNSAQPSMDSFEYSFDNLANLMEAFVDQLGIDKYSLYLTDFGAPIGFRLAGPGALRHTPLVCDNGV